MRNIIDLVPIAVDFTHNSRIPPVPTRFILEDSSTVGFIAANAVIELPIDRERRIHYKVVKTGFQTIFGCVLGIVIPDLRACV